MERRVLLVFIFITFGFVAFLSGYLFITDEGLSGQSGSLIERFNNGIEKGHNTTPTSTHLSSRKIISFVSSRSNSKEVIAVDKNGNVVKIDTFDLKEVLIAKLPPKDLTEAVLSPDGSLVLYSFYDGNDKKYFYHNLKTGKLIEINDDISSAVFSLSNDLVYLSNTGNDGKLYLFKEGAVKELLNTRLTNAVISWSSDFISFVSYDRDGYGDLFILKDNEELNKIVSYQKNLNAKWSPSSQKLLFSSKDGSGVTHLYHRDSRGNEVLDLEVEADVSKCIWLTDETSIICGVKNNSSFKDELYGINLADKSKSLIATPNANLIIKEITTNLSKDAVFILNELDSKLYSLKIK